jgi:hypothetical protein
LFFEKNYTISFKVCYVYFLWVLISDASAYICIITIWV